MKKKKLKTKKNHIEQYKKIISKGSLYLSIGGMIHMVQLHYVCVL
jgi:hypothetical protein